MISDSVFSIDVEIDSGGGPTQQELLEQLQKCEISASRVSSTVSSRAPSPSPSLMSIMYPGFKPGASAVQAGTPTALLRSLGAPSNNLFQPIRRNSTTGSNLSLSAVNATSTTTSYGPLALNIPEERTVSGPVGGSGDSGKLSSQKSTLQPIDSDRKSEKAISDAVAATVIVEDSSITDESKLNQEKKEIAQMKHFSDPLILAHQRSRSNEIDYTSEMIAASSKPRRASFQTLPGSYGNLRAFRPVSASSTSSDTPSENKDSTSVRNTTSEHTSRILTPDCTSPSGSGLIARVSSEGDPVVPSPSASHHWSREFASLSDYFANDNNIELTDCD